MTSLMTFISLHLEDILHRTAAHEVREDEDGLRRVERVASADNVGGFEVPDHEDFTREWRAVIVSTLRHFICLTVTAASVAKNGALCTVAKANDGALANLLW